MKMPYSEANSAMQSQETTELKLSSFQKQFIASGIGSGISSLILNPLVVVKVRLQNSVNSGPLNSSPTMVSVIRRIFQQDGIGGFYNGGKAALIQSLPSSIIYMTCYETLKRQLEAGRGGPAVPVPEFYYPAVAAAMARTVSVTVISPIELVRTIQASGVDKSIMGIVRDVRTQTGVLGLYRGWSSTVLRDVPYSAIYFLTFERLKPIYSQFMRGRGVGLPSQENGSNEGSSSSSSSAAVFAAGSTAGLVAALFTHPFDVIKTQRQLSQISVAPEAATTAAATTAAATIAVSSSSAASTASTSSKPVGSGTGSSSVGSVISQHLKQTRNWYRRYANWLVHNKNEHHCCVNRTRPCANSAHIAISLCKQFGVLRGLFRGLSMRLLTVMPAGAIMLTIYETVKANL